MSLPAPAPPARSATRDWRVHAALLVVQLAFASQAVEGKIAMGARVDGGEGISPFALAMVRMLGATVFFQIFTRAAKLLRPTTTRDKVWLAGLSLLGITLNQTLFLFGLRLTTPMTAALVGVTIPVIAAAMAVGVGQERASLRLVAGLGSSIAGVAWLTLVGRVRVDVGGLVVLANCASYAAYIVYSRETVRRLGALTVVTWIFTWGAALFAPLGLPYVARELPTWSARGWELIAYIVVMPTIVAYLCNAWALGRSSATLVTIYVYVQPVFTALLAWVQLGQAVTGRVIGAAVLIVVGVSIVATRKNAIPAPLQE